MDFWGFLDQLSKQMLTYDLLKRDYKGSVKMRVCTAQTKKGCVKVVGQIEEEDISPNRPSYLHLCPAKGKHAGKNYFHDYHDDCLFGIC